MGTQTTVDVLRLEDFRRSLDGRLAEAVSMLERATDLTRAGRLPLGYFHHATAAAEHHETLRQAYVDWLTQLKQAVEVTIVATDAIIASYRQTEGGITASATEIEERLGRQPGLEVAMRGAAAALAALAEPLMARDLDGERRNE